MDFGSASRVNNHNVTPKEAFLQLPTHESTCKTGYKRTLDYREWRNRAAAALFEANHEDDAVAFLRCAEAPYSLISSTTPELPDRAVTVWVCDHDNSHDAALYFATCDLRVCPDCAHRQVARFAARYVPAVLACVKKRGQNRLRKIVLTTPLDLRDPTCKKQLRDYCKALGKLWKLLEKKCSQWSTEGTIEAFEFGPNGHKLHFHIYHYGRYLPKNEISKAWKELTGGEAYIVDVKSVAQDDDATEEQIANEVLETLKYSVKFWSKKNDGSIVYIDPELLPVLLSVLKGTRRVRTRGVFYNIPMPERQPLCCDTCNYEMLRIGVTFFNIWQSTGFTPKEYREMVEGKSLDLILANRSTKKNGKNNKSPPVQPQLFPEMDVSEYPGIPHDPS